MKRIRLKIGDIFEVPLENGTKRYFQFLGLDINQLNGETIRVFAKSYGKDEHPTVEEIVNDDVDFCSHVFIKNGIRDEVWSKYANSEMLGNVKKIRFMMYNEADDLYPESWYVWGIYFKRYREFKRLPRRFKNAYWGPLFQPSNIICKLTKGRFIPAFPDEEAIHRV